MGVIEKFTREEPLFVFGSMLTHGEDLNRGNTGEYLISYALERNIEEPRKIYRNLLVPKALPSETTEVDVLMLTDKGVFVFESKNYSGWIFGSSNQRQWTTCLNKSTKEKFFNPIMQNAGHIRALRRELGLPSEAFTSFIVFSERCELKKVPDNTNEIVVCRRNHLMKFVKGALRKPRYQMTAEVYDETERRLNALKEQSTDKARKEHAKRIQDRRR